LSSDWCSRKGIPFFQLDALVLLFRKSALKLERRKNSNTFYLLNSNPQRDCLLKVDKGIATKGLPFEI
jgi:hypothetical protein